MRRIGSGPRRRPKGLEKRPQGPLSGPPDVVSNARRCAASPARPLLAGKPERRSQWVPIIAAWYKRRGESTAARARSTGDVSRGPYRQGRSRHGPLEFRRGVAHDRAIPHPESEFRHNVEGHQSLKPRAGLRVRPASVRAARVDWMPFAGRRHSGHGTGGIGYIMHDMTEDKMAVVKL